MDSGSGRVRKGKRLQICRRAAYVFLKERTVSICTLARHGGGSDGHHPWLHWRDAARSQHVIVMHAVCQPRCVSPAASGLWPQPLYIDRPSFSPLSVSPTAACCCKHTKQLLLVNTCDGQQAPVLSVCLFNSWLAHSVFWYTLSPVLSALSKLRGGNNHGKAVCIHSDSFTPCLLTSLVNDKTGQMLFVVRRAASCALGCPAPSFDHLYRRSIRRGRHVATMSLLRRTLL